MSPNVDNLARFASERIQGMDRKDGVVLKMPSSTRKIRERTLVDCGYIIERGRDDTSSVSL